MSETANPATTLYSFKLIGRPPPTQCPNQHSARSVSSERTFLHRRPSENSVKRKSNFAEFTSVLKNSSMLPSWLRSKAQRPAIAVFESCFKSVCVPFWSMDRSDKDFFNRLLPSTTFVNKGKRKDQNPR